MTTEAEQAITLIVDILYVIAILSIIPAVLNFKYYIQLRVKDYLLLFLYFFFQIFTAVTRAYEIDTSEGFAFFWSEIFNQLKFIAITLVIIRIKWDKLPRWSYSIFLYFTFIAFLGVTRWGSNNKLGVWPVNFYLNQLHNFIIPILIFYVFFTTDYFKIKRRIVLSRRIWLLWAVMFVLQIPPLLYYNVILQQFPNEMPLWALYLVLWPQVVQTSLILILHVFFPKAVLITHEQLISVQPL